MARKVMNYTSYTFNPATRTIVLPQYLAQERLILITNVTRDQVLFNFSDPSRQATTYTNSVTGATGSTTIVLAFNTTSMLATDKLSIVIDEYNEKMVPSQEFTDPVGKFRVSTPQSMIDTDFEYGNQTSKWEQIGLTNFHPSSYNLYPPITYTTVSSIQMPAGQRVVTVATSGAHGLSVGNPIQVLDTFLTPANGNFIIETVPTTTTFTYSANAINSSNPPITNIFDTYKTNIYQQAYYTGASIGAAPSMSTNGQVVTVTTTIPHGLSLGNEIAVSGVTGTNPPNGNFQVTGITSPTTFTYVATSGAPSALTTTGAVLSPRNQSMFTQRPFDGGVLFGPNSFSNQTQSIRQTRRNFHYQSGKGLQMATGTILKPTFTIDNLVVSGGTANNNNIIVQTRETHNLQPGVSITIGGATTSGYNGTYAVNQVLNANQFSYIASGIPPLTPATGNFYASVNGWYGASTRIGMMNQADGAFWEYDGISLYAVLRSSIQQISGRASVTNGSSVVTQTDLNFPTYFSKQLVPGQYIVIRGLSYRVIDIISDTQMNISPPYRGATNTYVTVTQTIEKRIPQALFNLDRIDGTGPSGYTIDITKMQMWFIDYSWYGAGAVRWGIRTTEGDITYVHKIANNNVNTAAYMRSGNLPARYETSTNSPTVFISPNPVTGSGVLSTDTVLYTTDTRNAAGQILFPASGTLLIRNSSAYEYVNYAAVTSGGFSGLTRGQAGNLSLATSMASGTTIATVASTAGLQVGQRVATTSGFPVNTYITGLTTNSTVSLSNAALIVNPTIVAIPMGNTATAFPYSYTAPTVVELAYPNFSPTISHWGTAVVMDGGFDPDKNLQFTYGMINQVTIASGQTKALLSVRIGPSVDNSLISSVLGSRELTNRVQLQMQVMDAVIAASGNTTGNVLVKAVLNGVPYLISGGTLPAWTNAVGGAAVPNSSLSQIVDYSSVANGVTISGGETINGFFAGGVGNPTDLSKTRDLGNSILGGAGNGFPNSGIYPDGPDTLTLVATNVGNASASILGRITWVEPQA